MNEELLFERAKAHKDRDFLQIATAFNETVRIYVAKTTKIVNDAQAVHKMYPTSLAALGRTLTATVIMGGMLKQDQSIAVKIEGDGPIGKIVCEADSTGRVMGYLHNPEVFLQYKNGKLNVGDAVGHNGTLSVVKDLHLKEPFTSSVPIINGEIAEDFAYYFALSEQVPSSVSLGVLVGVNGEALAAGGFIIQAMPDCKEETIIYLENRLKDIAPISTMIKEEKTGREILKEILGDNEFQVLKNAPIHFGCSCTKERFRKGIMSLGKKTVRDLLEKDHGLTATCQYCGKAYSFTEDELKEMLKEMGDAC